jgi:hypothetical protein
MQGSKQEISKSVLTSCNEQLHKTTCTHSRVMLSSVKCRFDDLSRLYLNANQNPIVSVALNHQVKARDTFDRVLGG